MRGNTWDAVLASAKSAHATVLQMNRRVRAAGSHLQGGEPDRPLRAEYPLKSIEDRWNKDKVVRDSQRRARPLRVPENPLMGFTDDAMDPALVDTLFNMQPLPDDSQFRRWQGGTEVQFMDFHPCGEIQPDLRHVQGTP